MATRVRTVRERVPRRLDAAVERLHGSRAYRLWLCGHGGSVTIWQALDFWGGTEGFRAVPVILESAAGYAGGTLASGMVLDEALLGRLRRCHDELARKFARRVSA